MNKLTSKAATAFRFALVMALGAGVLAAQDAPKVKSATEADKQPEKLEKFEVTGSRIKRLDIETPSPVIVMSRAELAATGFTNVDDALRAMPFNNGQAIVPEGSGNGFASGTSTVNLRGLGTNNTLVLINGRRAVPSGAGAFNGFQSVIDLRQIPTAAIESIEVLKDGASAIYGSDAVAGVLNIKLRRSYTGVSTDLSIGNTFHKDAFERSAFIIAGSSTAKTSIMTTMNWVRQNDRMDRDFDFSKTADLRNDKTSTGQLEADASGNILIGADLRSSNTFPARFFIPGTNTIRTFLSPTTDPNSANAVATSRVTGAGLYDFQGDTSQTPKTDFKSFAVYAKHDFNDFIYGFMDLAFSRVLASSQSAPAPFTTTDKGAGTAGRLLVPADNPFNPYGERYFPGAGRAIELSTFRLVNVGPRINDTTSDYPRLLFGVGGKLPKDWSWEAGYMYAQGSFENLSPGTAFDSLVQNALQGVTINGKKLYANPFGKEDPAVTDYYSGTNPTKTTFTGHVYDVSLNGEIFELPAGSVGFAAGAELRREKILDVRTLENETGNVVGGSEGFGYTGARRVISLYAEVKIPILKSLELQLAGRREDYSDFGKTTKPKVALAYRPLSWLLIRGSVSQSFKAPDLAFLYSAGSVSFTSGQVFDPRRPDQPSNQLKVLGKGNSSLQPETTDTYYGGIVVDIPRGPLKGLSFDAGYFRFEQKSLITRDSSTFTLTNELNLPAGRVVRKPITPAEAAAGFTVGIIDYISTDWYNSNAQTYEGYDFGVSYTLKTARFGQFRAGAQATYLSRLERQNINSLGALSVVDLQGNDNNTLWRGNSTLSWRKSDWAVAVFLSYVGGFPPGGLTTNPEPYYRNQVRVNPQVSYSGLWHTTFTVGVRNAFDKAPPRYLDNSTGYYNGVGSAEPAFWYVRASREF